MALGKHNFATCLYVSYRSIEKYLTRFLSSNGILPKYPSKSSLLREGRTSSILSSCGEYVIKQNLWYPQCLEYTSSTHNTWVNVWRCISTLASKILITVWTETLNSLATSVKDLFISFKAISILKSFWSVVLRLEEVNGFSSLNVLPHSQRYTLRLSLIIILFSLAEACLIVWTIVLLSFDSPTSPQCGQQIFVCLINFKIMIWLVVEGSYISSDDSTSMFAI